MVTERRYSAGFSSFLGERSRLGCSSTRPRNKTRQRSGTRRAAMSRAAFSSPPGSVEDVCHAFRPRNADGMPAARPFPPSLPFEAFALGPAVRIIDFVSTSHHGASMRHHPSRITISAYALTLVRQAVVACAMA